MSSECSRAIDDRSKPAEYFPQVFVIRRGRIEAQIPTHYVP